MSSCYCGFRSDSDRASPLHGGILQLMSDWGARSPSLHSLAAGLKHPSLSPTSHNSIRKRVDGPHYFAQEYLICGDRLIQLGKKQGRRDGVVELSGHGAVCFRDELLNLEISLLHRKPNI